MGVSLSRIQQIDPTEKGPIGQPPPLPGPMMGKPPFGHPPPLPAQGQPQHPLMQNGVVAGFAQSPLVRELFKATKPIRRGIADAYRAENPPSGAWRDYFRGQR